MKRGRVKSHKIYSRLPFLWKVPIYHSGSLPASVGHRAISRADPLRWKAPGWWSLQGAVEAWGANLLGGGAPKEPLRSLLRVLESQKRYQRGQDGVVKSWHGCKCSVDYSQGNDYRSRAVVHGTHSIADLTGIQSHRMSDTASCPRDPFNTPGASRAIRSLHSTPFQLPRRVFLATHQVQAFVLPGLRAMCSQASRRGKF